MDLSSVMELTCPIIFRFSGILQQVAADQFQEVLLGLWMLATGNIHMDAETELQRTNE